MRMRWLERKIFLGEVVRDYGNLHDKRFGFGIGRLRTSVLLCRKKGQLRLVFRSVTTSFMSAGANYAMIDATPEALATLADVVIDAQSHLDRQEADTSTPRQQPPLA